MLDTPELELEAVEFEVRNQLVGEQFLVPFQFAFGIFMVDARCLESGFRIVQPQHIGDQANLRNQFTTADAVSFLEVQHFHDAGHL